MSKQITVEALQFLKEQGVTSFNEIPDELMEKWRNDHIELFDNDSSTTPEEREIQKMNYRNAALMRHAKHNPDKIDKQNYATIANLDQYQFEKIIIDVKEPLAVSDPIYIACSQMLIKGYTGAQIGRKLDINRTTINRKVGNIRSFRFIYVDNSGEILTADTAAKLNSLIISNGFYHKRINTNYVMWNHHGYLKDGRVIVGKMFKQVVIQPIDLMDANGVIAATNY